MASSASIDLVQQAYIAYYGRPADQAGLDFWCQELDNNGGDLTAIVDAFANSDEYAAYLGDLALEERLNAIYQNAFNRDGDADGIAFWKDSIDNGTITEAQASLAILQGGIDAGDPDATVVANKVAVAKSFTESLDDVIYDTDQIEDARAIVAAIDGTQETVDAAADAIQAFVDANPDNTPDDLPEGLNIDVESAAGVDSARITGDVSIRWDQTNPENQLTGADLNDNGVIDLDGLENAGIGDISGFEIVDAYARNPLNQSDEVNNFTGDINYDGTGFAGDGTSTDGNIFLGGLGVDTVLGGIGNDFLAGGGVAQGRFVWDPLTNTFLQDTKYGTTGNNIPSTADYLFGGRNADFFFAELSLLDPADGDNLIIDGGNTTDDRAAGQGNTNAVGQSSQDSDWLLIEASDDDETTVIDLNPAPTFASAGGEMNQLVVSNSGVGITMSEIEHVNASGNLFGFLNDLNTTIGGRAGVGHAGDGSSNYGLGSSAQLDIRGSMADNIIIAGYDNDLVDGEEGNDILFGGDLAYIQNNPNAAGVVNNGVDTLIGGTGSDHVVFELDGGTYTGDAAAAAAGTDSDTLWIESNVAGTATVADLTADGWLRIDLRAPAQQGQGTGGNETASQSQTNSTLAGTVTGFENVIATGLGAIDYLASGTNNPELNFDNQQNYAGLGDVNLDLRGSDGLDNNAVHLDDDYSYEDGVYDDVHVVDNRLYADAGDDIIEGRNGNDYLSGGDGADQFIFAIDGDASGDDVDVIHRQADEDGDGIWDGSNGQFADGGYVRDFAIGGDASVSGASLTLTIDDPEEGVDSELTNIPLESVSLVVNGETLTLQTDAMTTVTTVAAFAAEIETAIAAQAEEDGFEFLETFSVSVFDDNTIVITDSGDSTIAEGSWGFIDGQLPANTDIVLRQVAGTPDPIQQEDRLIYKAYEDRADNEAVDDNAIKGSNLSLGDTAYAEDLVIDFSEDGTRIAESQKYKITFTNLTTEDVVTITINGVEYELCVGKDIDGNHIPAEDTTTATQADIQEAFIARLADFINSFMDDDTAAGKITAADADPTSLTVAQDQYDGEETVFIDTPVVEIQNLSGGEAASSHVDNISAHQVLILDFDGRNNELDDQNVLFWGAEGYIDEAGVAHNSRAILETALDEGDTLVGSEAIVINAGTDDLIGGDITADGDLVDSMTDEGIYVSDYNQVVSATIGDNFALHGDDLLIGGLGNDVISGGTGDDRIIVSADAVSGTDVVDGGKDLYFVRTVGATKGQIEVLNAYEAEQRDGDSDVAEIVLVEQLEEFAAGLIGGTEFVPYFRDTLLAQQDDFQSGVTTFTITLNNYQGTGAGIILTEGGAGTLTIDEDNDGVADHTTLFTNFENIRTVSGTGLATAGNGQGNDTLDVTSMSTDSDGITYNLTNNDVFAGNYTIGKGEVWVNTGAGFDTDPTDDANVDPDPIDPENTIYQEYVVPVDSNVVLSVDGVENVEAGLGNDTLLIDETEAAKNNMFSASQGNDALIYMNDYTGISGNPLSAEPIVTVVVNSSTDTDRVEMTAGRVGNITATDTLSSVEFVNFEGNTAQGTLEDDTLDVSALATGAVVDYTDGDIENAAGETELVIGGITQFENVEGSGGNDWVRVADEMTNSREDVADTTAATDLIFDSFMNYDMLDERDESVAPQRLSVSDLRTITAGTADTNDEGDIPESVNVSQYTFDLDSGTDTVSYYNETGTVAIALDFSLETGESTGDLNVMVNDDSADDMIANPTTSMTDAGDRIDLLKGVERVVASQGESVIDLTNGEKFLGENETFLIQYGSDSDGTDDATTGTISRTVLLSKVSSGEASEPFSGLSLVEIVDNDEEDFGGATVPEAIDAEWNRIEGSDRNERVEFTDDQASTSHTVNLRGGNNEVNYNEKTRGIELTVDDLTDGVSELSIQALTTDGVGTGIIDTITSYNSNNVVAEGALRVEASQSDDDTINLAGLTDNNAFILGKSEGNSDVLEVTFGEGDDSVNMTLTGFELLRDGSGDDVYEIEDLDGFAATLELQDNAAADRDTIKLTNDAFGNVTLANDTIMSITSDLEIGTDTAATDLDFLGIDWSILDISEVTNRSDLTATFGGLGTGTDPEIIVGDLEDIISIDGFQRITFSEATTNTVIDFNLDDGELQNSQGGALVEFNGSQLDLSMTSGNDYTVEVVADGGAAALVRGSDGNDIITGGAGNDNIEGGAGNDTLRGGGNEVQNTITVAIDVDFGGAAGGFAVTVGTETYNTIAADGANTIGEAIEAAFAANPAATIAGVVPTSVEYANGELTITFAEQVGAALVDADVSSADANIIFLNAANVSDFAEAGAGDDLIAGGQGVDTIDTGAGADTIVVRGVIEAGEYVDADLVGTAAASVGGTYEGATDYADVIVAGQTTSDVTTDSYNGGDGVDTMEVWGEADFTDATVENIEIFNIHSDVTFLASQIEDATEFNLLDADSKVNIVDNGETVTYTSENIATLNDMLTVKVDGNSQDAIDNAGDITTDGFTFNFSQIVTNVTIADFGDDDELIFNGANALEFEVLNTTPDDGISQITVGDVVVTLTGLADDSFTNLSEFNAAFGIDSATLV